MSGTKLELTWPGKNKAFELEPRILIEKPELNYGDPNTENMLIHGDNLLALKALEQQFTGKIKCIYIDPPYNTGSAFDDYEDGLEHSEWLNLMRPRLELLRSLLRDDGLIFISIDNKEGHYLKVLCDEVFGRSNFRSNIIWKKVSSAKTQSNFLGNVVEYILLYSKTNDALFYPMYLKSDEEKDLKNYPYIEEDTGRRYGTFDFTQKGQGDAKKFWGELLEPPTGKHRIWTQEKIDEGIKNNLIVKTKSGLPRLKRYLDNKKGNYISDLRDDNETSPISANSKEALNFFGQKSEGLIKRVLELGSKEGDLVLDSFLGSGTTAAVAHKLGRKWIGIELGEQAYTHCKPRIDKVINGEQSGISTAVDWQGGGGYKFYELGPSVLLKDKYGNYIINPNFNSSELVQAICKIENFTYKAFEDNIKHGYSTEKDYIHVTTRHVTQEIIKDIQETSLKHGETMLIVAKTFESNLDLPDNIQIKKIPTEILDKCEYNKDNYSLPITKEEIDDQE